MGARTPLPHAENPPGVRPRGATAGGSAHGVRLLGEDTLEKILEVQSDGMDLVLGVPLRFGLGFGMPPAEEPTGPNSEVFGHSGAGGSYGQADPENRSGFGYSRNLMHTGWWMVDPRPRALLRAVHEALA